MYLYIGAQLLYVGITDIISFYSYARREMILELSCQGFFGTGLKPDVTQYALLMPKVVDTVRFSQSLAHLQKKIGYKFKNLHHLQVLCE